MCKEAKSSAVEKTSSDRVGEQEADKSEQQDSYVCRIELLYSMTATARALMQPIFRLTGIAARFS